MSQSNEISHPKAVIVVAPNPVHRNELAEMAREEAVRTPGTRGEPIRIDEAQLEARGEKNAAGAAEKQLDAAMRQGKDVVIVDRQSSPESLNETAGKLSAAGYKVEVKASGVDLETAKEAEKLQSEMGGRGRPVNDEAINKSYEATPKIVERLEQGGNTDAVRVYSRSGEPVYQSAGEGQQGGRAALEKERERELSYHDLKAKNGTLTEIKELQEDRGIRHDPVIQEKLNAVQEKLHEFEKSPGFQRAESFDQGAFNQNARRESLAKYPELDGAYAQLRDVKKGLDEAGASQDVREATYFKEQYRLSDEIRSGKIPEGNVSREESMQVMKLAATQREIGSVRDGGEATREVRGEIVAETSRHALVKVGDNLAVAYPKENLDREVSVGERVSIQPAQQGRSHVQEHGATPPQREAEQARGMER